MIEYLTIEQVIVIHQMMIKKFGGLPGIRDKNLLLSALELPKTTYEGIDLYPTIFDKAAVYLYHLTRNHPFNDGNKRTAFFVVRLFLKTNDTMSPLNKKEFEEIVVLTAQGKMSKEQLAFAIENGSLSSF